MPSEVRYLQLSDCIPTGCKHWQQTTWTEFLVHLVGAIFQLALSICWLFLVSASFTLYLICRLSFHSYNLLDTLGHLSLHSVDLLFGEKRHAQTLPVEPKACL